MGRRKRRSAPKNLLCSVCLEPYCSSTSVTRPCSSHLVLSQHTICDLCLYKHILTIISHDITNRVICPEQGCNAEITNNTIKMMLLTNSRQDLWDDYVLKSNWRGTSEQWMKQFTARCPNCRVPIEKNGGCNRVLCAKCQFVFDWAQAKNSNLNPFGGNPFGGGFPQQFPGSFPQQGFGQFGSGGGFYNPGVPFQGGNVFQGGSQFPPAPPPPPPQSGFPPQPISGQFGQGFGFPPAPGGFGFQQSPYAPQFPPGQQPPYAPQFPPGQQPPYAPQFPPGQQPFYGNPNYFGSGSYGQPRSRHSSRHRSKTRRHRSSSSSSSTDEHPNRGSPFGGRGNPYGNVQPFPNMPPISPRGGSPVVPPRRPVW